MFTTSNKTILSGIREGEYPIVYDPPKPEKIIPTERDLFRFDCFGFGSKIGQYTNRGATAICLLNYFEDKYGKDSWQWKLTNSRVQQVCKLQSTEIDCLVSLYSDIY